MNYRHAFHAGSFADVHKHVVLTRILAHLREKPAAFRVIDSHAGGGRYDLLGEEASRSGEWRNGIARLQAAGPPPADVASLLAPYLETVSACNTGHDGGRGAPLRYYPGSPLIALHQMRRQDRLIACEIEPSAASNLLRATAGDGRAKVIGISGYVALNAYLPPKERRGLVLVDPPFERPDEFPSLHQAVVKAWRKWPTGIFLLWYPRKDRHRVAVFARELAGGVTGAILRVELEVGSGANGLAAAGLFVINPPWRLADELKLLFDWLAPVLAQAPGFAHRLDWVRR